MNSSYYGYSNISKMLVEHGAEINATNYTGMTALMFASEFGYIKIVKYLVVHGADMHATNDSNKNALMFGSSFEILEYFQEIGIQKIKTIISKFYIQLFMKNIFYIVHIQKVGISI